jgi:hypothetical protein
MHAQNQTQTKNVETLNTLGTRLITSTNILNHQGQTRMTEKTNQPQKTQGKTTDNNNSNNQQSNNKLLSPKAGALSVLSYPSTCFYYWSLTL